MLSNFSSLPISENSASALLCAGRDLNRTALGLTDGHESFTTKIRFTAYEDQPLVAMVDGQPWEELRQLIVETPYEPRFREFQDILITAVLFKEPTVDLLSIQGKPIVICREMLLPILMPLRHIILALQSMKAEMLVELPTARELRELMTERLRWHLSGDAFPALSEEDLSAQRFAWDSASQERLQQYNHYRKTGQLEILTRNNPPASLLGRLQQLFTDLPSHLSAQERGHRALARLLPSATSPESPFAWMAERIIASAANNLYKTEWIGLVEDAQKRR